MRAYNYSTDTSYSVPEAEVFTGTTDAEAMDSYVEVISPFANGERNVTKKEVYNWEEPIRPEWTPLYTELYALYCGVIIAKQAGAQKVCVKADSRNLIQFLNSYSGEEERIPEQDTRELMADLYTIGQSMDEFNVELRPEYH